MKHTIEQLREMPDTELAELTARLRGWTTDGLFLRDSGDPLMHKLHWTPAADIAQAYGLLTWAMERDSKIEFHLHLMRRRSTGQPCISVCSYGMSGSSVMYEVSGIDARAMVYAFVLAMEEVSK